MKTLQGLKRLFVTEQQDVETFLLRVWIITVSAILLASAVGHLFIGLNNDHLAQFYMAQTLVKGGRIYVDTFDVNPPLIYVLYTLPLILAKMLSFPLHGVFNVLVLALVFFSLYGCAVVMRASRFSYGALCATLGATGLVLLSASFIEQVYGDREHLLMVLIAPLLLLYSPWAEREAVERRTRTIIACAAAVGLALKPHFYVFFLALVASEWIRTRSFKRVLQQRELLTIVKVTLAYIAVVILFFFDFVSVILPISRLIYEVHSWGADSKLGAIINTILPGYALIPLVGTLLIACASPSQINRKFGYMGLLALAGLASYWLNAGWKYTQYPLIAIMLPATLWLTLLALNFARSVRNVEVRGASQLIACLLVAWGAVESFGKPAFERAAQDLRSQQLYGQPLAVQRLKPEVYDKLRSHLNRQPRYAILNNNFWGFHLERESGKYEQSIRFSSLGPLPSLIHFAARGDRQEEYKKLLDYTIRSLSEDLIRRKPGLVIVDVSPQKRRLPNDYSILNFLTAQPHFADAWQDYQLIETINTCDAKWQSVCAYDIYYRRQF